jgi:hypothetical protein
LEQLEANLLAEKRCRDPLVRWNGILIDGHNRLPLLKKHDLPFHVLDIDLPDRSAALAWIALNQLGKRNLTDGQLQYLRGRQYLAEKQGHGGERKSDGASGQRDHLTTAERLAQEHKVSPRTIRRDGEFAAAVDTLAANCGPTVKQKLLTGEANLDRESVCKLSALDSVEQPAAVEKAIQAPKAKKLKTKKPKAKKLKDTAAPIALEAAVPAELVLRRADGPVRWAKDLIVSVGPEVATELHRELGQALQQLQRSTKYGKGSEPQAANPAGRAKTGKRKTRKAVGKPKAPPVR